MQLFSSRATLPEDYCNRAPPCLRHDFSCNARWEKNADITLSENEVIKSMMAATEVVFLNEDDVPGAKLLKKPLVCSVTELKRWLECRGAKKSGTKKVLIERVEGCLKIKMKIDPKIDGGKWYEAKARKIGAADAPTKPSKDDTLLESSWKDFPSRNIPPMFNYGNIYYYLIESVPMVADAFGNDSSSDSDYGEKEEFQVATAKPSKKGSNLVKSKFLDDVQDNEGYDSYALRAHIHHSMKKELPLSTQIALSKSASCTCVAKSLGRCAHVAALLLFLNDYITKNSCHVEVPKTSLSCYWNKGKRRSKNPMEQHKAIYNSPKEKVET